VDEIRKGAEVVPWRRKVALRVYKPAGGPKRRMARDGHGKEVGFSSAKSGTD